MYAIDNVTADAKQTQTLVLPDGSSISFSIFFVSMQFGWFIKDLSYKDFKLSGLRICNSPNMLHQFRNQIPFGLACFSDKDREPSQQQDFLSGQSKLYVLTADEVNQYVEVLTGEV